MQVISATLFVLNTFETLAEVVEQLSPGNRISQAVTHQRVVNAIFTALY